MNEPTSPSIPPTNKNEPQGNREFICAIDSQRDTLLHWLKRFFACNPFYLLSAALLLFGLYRVSIEPGIFAREYSQLTFNFGALQGYEALLVVTAIFLFRRGIRYDSGLLVGVENALALVPFILISAQALIDAHVVWGLCFLGGFIAAVRFVVMKLGMLRVNAPPRLCFIGLLVLAVNVALPIVYRTLHEGKVGTKPTWGAAYYCNEYAWLLVVPLLVALLNLVSWPRRERRLTDASLIPLSLMLLWIIATVVHLYSLGYVYDFDLRPALVSPAIWVLLWTLRARLHEGYPREARTWRFAALIAPFAAALLGLSRFGNEVFEALTLLNVLIYVRICLRRTVDQKLALHLVCWSLLGLIAGMPEEWGQKFIREFTSTKGLAAGTAIYFLVWAARSTDPKMGVFGALVSAAVTIGLLGNLPGAGHRAFQCAVAFLLTHSLRWNDEKEIAGKGVRIVACIAWLTQSIVWSVLDNQGWAPLAITVLAIFLLTRWLGGKRMPVIVPVTAVLVLLVQPSRFAAGELAGTPPGILLVAGSFVLLGVGTVAAVLRNRWTLALAAWKKLPASASEKA